MIKRVTAISLSVIIALFCLSLTACTQQEQRTAVQSTDKYRNFYEIFVYSFNDSNGDGIGDINGITEKLDYLNDGDPTGGDDLGIDGIWLMPVSQSVSYHKYSVEDYKSIDESYGTMEDFEAFLAECDKRGIKVIIDLVVNHSSNKHPWFEQAVEEAKEGNLEGYAKYYHFVKEENFEDGSEYNPVPGVKDLYYESNFDVAMPELNLNEPKVREELSDIMKFWLNKGVAGFRLDAVKFFSSGGDDGEDFLKWIDKEAKAIKEDTYIIAENWSGSSDIADSYATGIDSLFNFPMSGADGDFCVTEGRKDVSGLMESLKAWQETIKEQNENAIDAPFLSNHDTIRSGIGLGKELVSQKTAAMLYLFAPGNPFIYYGEELGMEGNNGSDSSYRLPMPWTGNEPESIAIPGVDTQEALEAYPINVTKAQEDENSLFHFYQKLIKLKLENPEIARGTITKVVETEESSFSGMVLEYEGESVMVIYNLADEQATQTISKDIMEYSKIVGEATAQDAGENGEYPKAELNEAQLTLPSKSIAILRA